MSVIDSSCDGRRPFRILSLDGGGIRGAFGAGFLACLEERLQCRVSEFFDLIAGTSTGAIIAAAVAMGEPASRIKQFYRERGSVIFRRPWERPAPSLWEGLKRSVRRAPIWCANRRLRRFGIDYDWLLHPKYDGDELRRSLVEVFGEHTLEAVRRSRLVIPSVDLTRGHTVVFKTPHMPGLVRDRRYRIVDVLLATTAAPTYLPHATIGNGSAYVDGGIWANNPGEGKLRMQFGVDERSLGRWNVATCHGSDVRKEAQRWLSILRFRNGES